MDRITPKWSLRLQRGTLALFTAVFFGIFVQIFLANSAFGYSPLLQTALLCVWLLFCAGIVWAAHKKIDCLVTHRYQVLALAVLALFAIQVTVGILTEQQVDHDYGKVFNGALIYVQQGDCDAFAMYKNYYHHFTNNTAPFLLLVGVFSAVKALGLSCYYQAAILLGHLLFAVAVAATFWYLDHAFGAKAALLSLVFWLCFLPVWFQSSILYTDTMTIAAVPLLLCLWEKSKQANAQKKLVWWAAMGLLLMAGAELKATALLCGIAIFCEALLSGKPKQTLAALLVIALVFTGASAAFNSYTYDKVLDRQRVYNESMPVTYWLMMGLMGDGSYNPTDEWVITCSVTGLAERKAVNLEVIKERLREMGPVGYLQLLHRKTCRTFGSGNGEVNYLLCRGPLYPQRMIYRFISTEGGWFRYFDNLAQCVYLSFYLLAVAGAALAFRRSEKTYLHHTAPFFALMGFFAFMMLWESNHRLLVNQWPLFIIAAAAGAALLLEEKPHFIKMHKREQKI